MTDTAAGGTIPAVEQSVEVTRPPEEAFELFTAGFHRWWPKGHSIAEAPVERAVIEPRVGGRCFDACTDGSECQWGTVLAWEPPARLVLAWQVTHEWAFEPDVDRASRVTVDFTATPTGTRVTLRHDEFERHLAGGRQVADGVRGGWALPMAQFRALAQGEPGDPGE